MLYYENFDLENIVTPVDTKKLVKLLQESHYMEEEINFLEDGFLNGFDIGYEGPQDRQSSADNLPFQESVGNKTELWNKLMKEVKAKRVAGPFEKIPFKSYIQSPIGLVPKTRWEPNSSDLSLILRLQM